MQTKYVSSTVSQGPRLGTDQTTPQQYNKKSVKFDQGLDFLKVWGGKSRKTVGRRKENKENTIKIKKIRV